MKPYAKNVVNGRFFGYQIYGARGLYVRFEGTVRQCHPTVVAAYQGMTGQWATLAMLNQ
jgi:hypothetical protein